MSDSQLENWSPEKVKTALDKNEILLVDVRTPQEYLLEHIQGAVLFPMADFDASRLPKDSEKRIVLHCGSGARSAKAGNKCLNDGFARMAHMEGGFGAWKERKLPYVGTDMVTGAPKKMPG